MPINREKVKGDHQDETLFVIGDPVKKYSHEQVCDLLEKAEKLGVSLEKGCFLEQMTLSELEELVNRFGYA